MHNDKDQLSERIAIEIFDPYAIIKVEHEVRSPDAVRMDLWVEPRLPRPRLHALPSFLRLPVRMARRAAQIEFYAKTPDSDAVRDGQRRQLEWNHLRRLQARKEEQPLPPLFPCWFVSPGVPRGCFNRRRVRRARGWPPGFYWTDRDSELWFIVVSELERTRETLLLRLFGSARSRAEAIEDAAGIPAEDPERAKLLSWLDILQQAVLHDKTIPDSERTLFMTVGMAEHLKYTEKVRKEEAADMLLLTYRERFGQVPDWLSAALQAIADRDRLRGLLPLFLRGSDGDIATALRA